MTSEILTALSILTKPLSGAEPRDAQCTQQKALLTALRMNRSVLLEQLQKDLGAVRSARAEVLAGLQWFSDTGDITWDFVQEALVLLLTLAQHLSMELDRFHQTTVPVSERLRTPEMAPPLPPDVLSVSQQRTVATALQFVVSLGICPYLMPGVGVPLGQRSAFGVMVEKVVQGQVAASSTGRLWTTSTVLLQVAERPSLAALVFTRHLGDVIAALSQLGHQPLREDRATAGDCKPLLDVNRVRCKESLRRLLDQVYQPVVIKELLILQGGPQQACPAGGRVAPAWLRRLCGQLLSERLTRPSGVHAVVQAILERDAGAESDWRRYEVVAKILAACPQQCQSAQTYYQLVCPQILDLLHFRDQLTAMQFQRVATRAVLRMVQEKPLFAQQNLLTPLLAPLSRCSTACEEGDSVEESELTRCVEDVYKVWVVGNSPSSQLLAALEEVVPVLFALFCFTQRSLSYLRGQCEEILLWFLRRADPGSAQLTLKRLSGLLEQRNPVAAGFFFTAGSDGGVRLSCRDGSRDEDDVLFNRVTEEQWRLECLMQILAQLTDQDLPGDFFLDLLQEFTGMTSEVLAVADEPRLDVSAMSLMEVEQKMLAGSEQLRQRLVLLQVLAVMVETLQQGTVLRQRAQVVGFMETLLQRACVGLDQNPGQSPVESQTLSMGMGLVATLLSGPQDLDQPGDGAQSQCDIFSSMSCLLAPLLTLSQKHPEAFIRELATDLRAFVASRGIYRPETLSPAASRGSRGPQSHADVGRAPAAGGARPPSIPEKTFSDCLMEACDPDLPTRAVALRTFTRMLQRRDPEAQEEKDKLLQLFLESLQHEDSFIYLSAVQGLVVLADCFPEEILSCLLPGFQHGPDRCVESRLKMGEVLMRASRAMGELAPHLGCPLISVFLRGTRDLDPSVRASCLSNLGELCPRLGFALVPLAHELSSCLTALIKTEKEVEVRRAAVHVITLLLRGLAEKTTEVLTDVLLDLYRALKQVARSDPDPVSVLHAQLALEELDLVMRHFLFPKQKLEKKIVVLP